MRSMLLRHPTAMGAWPFGKPGGQPSFIAGVASAMSFGAVCRALAIGTVMIAATGTAQRATKDPVARLQPGRWQLRDLDAPSAAPRAICVADPHMLLQLEHRGASCSRLVVAGDQRSVTVHYTCAAEGFGQTTVRVTDPASARIETQGIMQGRPFNYRADARRAGSCRR